VAIKDHGSDGTDDDKKEIVINGVRVTSSNTSSKNSFSNR